VLGNCLFVPARSDQMLDKLFPVGRDKDADADARAARHRLPRVRTAAASV
jgi:hypothetical protein